jgi:hypothetical protein
MFGRWLGGGPVPVPQGGWKDGRPWSAADRSDAERFYREVSPIARSVLDLWSSRPGEWTTGEQTAEAVGVNGPKGVAGTLSSVGRVASKMSRQLPFEHRSGPGGTSGSYLMTPTIASLFSEARNWSAA